MSSKSNSLPVEARIPKHEDEDESQSEAKDVEGQALTTSRDQHHHDLPSSSALSTATKASSAAAAADPSDQGHRYGNFHNYYAFHPPSARMDAMKDIVDYIGSSWTPSRPEKQPKLHDGNSSNGPFQQSASTLLRNTPFTYLDVGCNEGDLTMGVAHALQVKLETTVGVTGVDIDGVLIDRANQKYNRQDVPSESSSSAVVTARFHVADACSTDQLQQVTTSSSQPPTNNEDGMGLFDLVSLFSTTMWIHVHAGDEGLTQVLQQLCHKARHFFIVEPQPSKCYRNAVVRLRKLGRPELDVSTNRLAFRANVATAIDAMVTKCGFQRVEWKEELHSTCWNRSLQLYERVTPVMRKEH